MIKVVSDTETPNDQRPDSWSQCGGLNPGPLPYHGSALPLSYIGRYYTANGRKKVFKSSFQRAGDETRTRDPQLGRLMLYQLSSARLSAGALAKADINIARLR